MHDGERMVFKNIGFVPGLYKIFDEILVNASDNKVRDASMDTLRVDIDVVGAARRRWRCPGGLGGASDVAITCSSGSGAGRGGLAPCPVHKRVQHTAASPASAHCRRCIAAAAAMGTHPPARPTRPQAKGCIKVLNNGAGIPVEVHKTEGIYVPELIFGNLLTSSNYNDNEKKVGGLVGGWALACV